MKKFYKNLFAVFIISLSSTYYSAAAAEFVIPSGEMVGIKIYTDGVLTAKTADFTDFNGKTVCPAREAGIRAGDIIKKVNGREITSCEDLSGIEAEGALQFEIERGGGVENIQVTPVKAEDGVYRIGLWARDSTAGIGTMTCVNPETMRYSALGHAVTDIDTGNIMTVNKGNIQDCSIVSVSKGHIGFPGSVSGDFGSEVLGDVDKNGENGISGSIEQIPDRNSVEVAENSQIYNGDAYILSDVEGGEVKEYSAKIEVIDTSGIRNMIIEITDSALIEATGGIVQGMSGAPIIQDGRLIGAVTHVFVNNPRKGYAIFAENLVK